MTSSMMNPSNSIDHIDQHLHTHSTSNVSIFNRLLSPIIEHSSEISLPTDLTQTRQIDRPNSTVLQQFYQYTTNFQKLQQHFTSIKTHLKELTNMIDYVENDSILRDLLDPIVTRLIPIDVKVDQIDRLLEEVIRSNIVRQISPEFVKSQSNVQYHELFASIQLSLNQKSTLIDHLKNEHRYMKYHVNEYYSKLKDRQDLLIRLSKQFDEYFQRDSQPIRPSLIDQHQQQRLEFAQLSEEFQRLEEENFRLKRATKENLQKFSHVVKFNAQC